MKILIALSLIIIVFLFWFYRKPRFKPPPYNQIISPAEGKIVKIEDDINDYGIYIQMNFWNIHRQYVPTSSKVIKKEKKKGKFILVTTSRVDKVITKNSSVITELRATHGDWHYEVVQYAGKFARRIKNYLKPGMEYMGGAPLGIITFGSMVKMTLPQTGLCFNKAVLREGKKIEIGDIIAEVM